MTTVNEVLDVFTIDVKSPKRNKNDHDYVKLGYCMKDMLNEVLDRGVSNPRIFGFIISGRFKDANGGEPEGSLEDNDLLQQALLKRKGAPSLDKMTIPDYLLLVKVFAVEVKNPNPKTSQILSDTAKLGDELKVMEDKLVTFGVPSPVVAGVVVDGKF